MHSQIPRKSQVYVFCEKDANYQKAHEDLT